MSMDVPPSTPHDCSGEAAAYALGALEPAEADAFRRHLETCVVCRDEVSAFERTVDALPSAVPQYRAPRTIRRRVMRDVRADARKRAAAAPRRHSRGAGARRPVLAGAGALATAVIALVLVLSLAGGGAHTHVYRAAVSGAGSAQLRVSGGRAELVLHHFPPPPAGEVYEVWLQRGAAAPSPTRTLFSVTSGGDADVGVAGVVSGVSRVMVTPERAGGSLVPTHAPVIVAPLA